MGTKDILTELKRVLGLAVEDLPEYVCKGCGERFELRRHICPNCGGFLIEREEWSRRDPEVRADRPAGGSDRRSRDRDRDPAGRGDREGPGSPTARVTDADPEEAARIDSE